MLRSLKDLRGYKLRASDDELGSVRDVLFDDASWSVRYVVAATGPWLFGRRVLLSWHDLGTPDWSGQHIPVALSKAMIKDSPGVDVDAPISRRVEQRLLEHYGRTPYWHEVYRERDGKQVEQELAEVHLRSLREVSGYRIQTLDGFVGHVEDLIADDVPWVIRYMVVDTRNWLPGRRVLVAPAWVEGFDWAERISDVRLTSEQVRNAPEFHPGEPVNREYEARLYDYYGRPTYWTAQDQL